MTLALCLLTIGPNDKPSKQATNHRFFFPSVKLHRAIVTVQTKESVWFREKRPHCASAPRSTRTIFGTFKTLYLDTGVAVFPIRTRAPALFPIPKSWAVSEGSEKPFQVLSRSSKRRVIDQKNFFHGVRS